MAKGDKKRDKAKLPREMAGVKLPKKLRKVGNRALKLAGQPIVSEAVAAALLSAAAALRNPPAGKASAKAGAAAAKEAGRVGESLRALALDLARRSLDAWEEGGDSRGSKQAGGTRKVARASGK